MSFEKFLDEDPAGKGFGSERYVKNFKERQNISKLKLDSDSGCEYLDENVIYHGTYDELGNRYCACVDLVYDAVVVLFDHNRRECLVYRFADFDNGRMPEFIRIVGASFGKKGAEARIIGLQNGQEFSTVGQAHSLLRAKGIAIVEIDLFGSEARQLAIDLKMGVTFDVLILNRPYRPGELANKLTISQFERQIKGQKGIEGQDDKNKTNRAKNLQ